MLEGFMKGILAGISLTEQAVEGTEDLVMRLMKDARMKEPEAKALAEEIFNRAAFLRADINKKIESEVQKALDTVGIAKKSDLEAAYKRIEALEEALELSKESSNNSSKKSPKRT